MLRNGIKLKGSSSFYSAGPSVYFELNELGIIILRAGSKPSLSHFLGAASVAPLWFFCPLSLALRAGSTPSLSYFRKPYGAASVAPMWFLIVLSLVLTCQFRLDLEIDW